MNIKAISLGALLIPLLTGCIQKKPMPCTGPYCTFDALHQKMVERVKESLIQDGAFQVVTTDFSAQIGTVLKIVTADNKTRIDFMDYTVCKPSQSPPAVTANSLFPSDTTSWGAALNMGLDSEVTSGLAGAGVSLSRNQKVMFSVKDTTAYILARDNLDEIFKRPDCKKSLSRDDVVIVRGFIQGKREFKTINSIDVKGNFKLNQIGNMSLEGESNNTITLYDPNPEHFVLLVASVKYPQSMPLRSKPVNGMVPRSTRHLNNEVQFEKPEILNGIGAMKAESSNVTTLPDDKVLIYTSPNDSTIKINNPDHK